MVNVLPVEISAFDAKGHVGQTILVKAGYSYCVSNNTDIKQNYVGYVDIEADGRHQQAKINFSLPPGQTLTVKNQLIFFKYKASRPGSFPITARIKIMNNAATYEASSNAVLMVTLT